MTFEEFKAAVLKECAKLGRGSAKDLKGALEADARAFLEAAQADLKTWLKALQDGKLSKMEFADLVEGQKALAKMHALTATGMSLYELKRLRDELIDAVVSIALKTLL